MDDFFRSFSKIVIIIPVVIIIIGLIIKYNEKSEKLDFSPTPILKTDFPTPTIINKKEEKIKFDFNGPLICYFQDEDYQITAYIKNKKINLDVNSKGIIKKYDLSSYVPFIEMILQNNDSYGINNLIKIYTGKNLDIIKIINNCEKKDF